MTIHVREARNEELPLIREQRVEAYRDHTGSISDEHWQALKKSNLI